MNRFEFDPSLLTSYSQRRGGHQLVMELIQIFKDQAPEKINRLQISMDQCDLAKTAQLLHSLKNSFGNVGARSSAYFCQQLQDHLENGRTLDPSDIAHLRSDVERVSEELSRIA